MVQIVGTEVEFVREGFWRVVVTLDCRHRRNYPTRFASREAAEEVAFAKRDQTTGLCEECR